MKIKSIVKYNINSLKNSIAIYYAIFITVCVASAFFSGDGNISSSGIELASVIFLFVAGLNLFKENFYFMKSNNVSRRDFIYGTAISIIPVVLFMAIIDIIINRIYNVFIKCPTLYDMSYANIGRGHFDNSVNWVQSNSIETLLSSIAFQGALCLFAISLGFLITIIYYRCNKLMKIVVSIFPVILFNLGGIVGAFYPDLIANIYKFIAIILGINTGNVYAAILTFIVLFIIFIGLARILTRKAIIKQ
ncbi:MAG: hypothetical protein E7212_05555 [Clostridium sartagoforme]|nr:hypothetical protein [Clostridium sartagoforme]